MIRQVEMGNMPDYYESTNEKMTKGDLIEALRCVDDDAEIFIETGGNLCRIKYVEKTQEDGTDSPAFITLIPDDDEILKASGLIEGSPANE